MKRHDLHFVSPVAWHAVIETRQDLAADPLVASWVDKGWPLIGRRPMPGDLHGVALGLPLPPFAGKRRLSFVVRPEDIIATSPPPALNSTRRVAPYAWWPAIEALDEVASRHSIEAKVFGSLAWQALTGLDYLTDHSDLDILLYVRHDTDLPRLADDVAEVDADAPVRIDGEFMRSDGAAVNWREFHSGAREVLIKTAGGTALVDRNRFVPGAVAS